MIDSIILDRANFKKCAEIIKEKMEDILDDETVKIMFTKSVDVFVDELEIALFGKEG